MQNSRLDLIQKIKSPLLLLGILLIAYLPVSSFLFSLKNDAFTDNFPNKYFFSEAIQAGIFPLWNPYLNFGYPIYADIGFAYYNPITWIMGFIGYNAYSFTIEVLLYIYISGLSMFTLSRSMFKSSSIASICAVMYMCSGFFIGNLQHINFLTGAAFLPLVIHYLLKLFQNPSLNNCLLFTLTSFLLCACGHPAIPIGTFYFLILSLVGLILYKPIEFSDFKSFILYISISIALLIALFLPAIYAYYNIYPYYGFTHQKITRNAGAYFNFKSITSVLFPFFSNTKGIQWNNDISMRNIYFSFTGLLFSLFALSQIKRKSVLIISAGIIIIFFSSVDGSINKWIFNHLPFLNFIRTNGEYRVFIIFILILLAAFGFQLFYSLPKVKFNAVSKKIKLLLYFLLLPLIFINAYLYQNVVNIFYVNGITDIKSNVKNAIEALSIYDFVFINSFILLLFIVLNILFLNRLKTIRWIVIIDLIFMCWTCLPFTGVGKTPVSSIQNLLNEAPKGFPAPPLQPISENKVAPKNVVNLIGNYSYYNKQIGVVELTDYPSYFTSTLQALERQEKNFTNKPFIFFNENGGTLKIIKFTPNQISLIYNNSIKDSIVMLQNKYPFWKAYSDDKLVPIQKGLQSFMMIETLPGQHNISFKYYDGKFIVLFFFSTLLFLTILILVIYYKRKN